jgi:hypothetical protein
MVGIKVKKIAPEGATFTFFYLELSGNFKL